MKPLPAVAAGAVVLVAATVALIPGGAQSTKCSYRGDLPDASCTPGLRDARVTQSNLKQTICKPGYTATVRPSTSKTNPIKARVEEDYGVPGPHPHPYAEEELDHLIPLELGGSPDAVRNLWPEPVSSYHQKDVVENRLHAAVCAGTETLSKARRDIAKDWRTA